MKCMKCKKNLIDMLISAFSRLYMEYPEKSKNEILSKNDIRNGKILVEIRGLSIFDDMWLAR